MRVFRSLSTRRLLALTALVLAAAVAAAAGAVAALGGGGAPPPPKGLAEAIHDALAAPPAAGVTARIRFTNHLLASGALGEAGGGSALLSGASGRLWVTAAGHVRLELQSEAGDTQIIDDGATLTVYDASSGTVYSLQLPQRGGAEAGPAQTTPLLARIQQVLDRLAGRLVLSGAQPDSVAGRSAYTLRVSPKEPAGLLGAAELSWDALAGVPLRFGLYAAGVTASVLELTATDVSFGPVSESTVELRPPASAHVVDLGGLGRRAGGGSAHPPSVTGLTAVQATLPFTLVAPDTLDGLARSEVRSATVGGSAAALVLYGHDLNGLAVLESAATGKDPLGKGLPGVTVNAAHGVQLETALGTVVRYEAGGVATVVAASRPAAAVLAAARELSR